MSETDFAQEPQSDDVSSRRAVRRPGMFDDPVVRTMAYVAGGLVILFLVAIVSVMITGVVGAGSNRSLRTVLPDPAKVFANSALIRVARSMLGFCAIMSEFSIPSSPWKISLKTA